MKPVERSTDRSPPPIFAKLATKAESLSFLVEIRKKHVVKPEVELIFTMAPLKK